MKRTHRSQAPVVAGLCAGILMIHVLRCIPQQRRGPAQLFAAIGFGWTWRHYQFEAVSVPAGTVSYSDLPAPLSRFYGDNVRPGAFRRGRYAMIARATRAGGNCTLRVAELTPAGRWLPAKAIKLPVAEAYGLTCSPDGKQALYYSVAKQRVNVWQTNLDTGSTRSRRSLAWQPEPSLSLAFDAGGRIYIWRESGRPEPVTVLSEGAAARIIGDYESVLTLDGGTFGVETVESSNRIEVRLTDLHRPQSAKEIYSYFYSLPEEQIPGDLVSTDDGQYYGMVTDGRADNVAGTIVIWRRHKQDPCAVLRLHFLRTFVMTGIARTPSVFGKPIPEPRD